MIDNGADKCARDAVESLYDRASMRVGHLHNPAPSAFGGWDCTCYHTCGEDSHSGHWHQHEDEPCPCHPDAPVVG